MTEQLFAIEAGIGSQSIVFLHGFGATHSVWGPMATRFSGSHHVLAYDLPGHGRSLGFPGAERAVRTSVAAVLEDLEDRKRGSVHLVGHSMGGAIAALMALRQPGQVRSLTLLAPGGFGPEINTRLLQRYAKARSEKDIRACLESMFGFARPIPDRTVGDHLEMRAIAGQTEKLIEIAAGLSERDGRQGAIGRDTLATLDMPVKVLWGTQDRVLPTRQAHRLPGHFAGHVFEDTGHMLPDEIPDAVIKLIAENVR